jgi:hypothetical protein
VLAPITLFCYSRLDHLKRGVESLLKSPLAKDSDLITYLDAAKTPDQMDSVDAVAAYLQTISGFKSISIRKRGVNFGLSKSIINGVSEVLEERGKIIVLEDDLVFSSFFLEYMNEALDLYARDTRVVSIHGYIYPTLHKLPEAFFLRGADCWGWGTWKRAWDNFNPNGKALLEQLKTKGLTKAFDFDGAYPYTKMLEDQILGRNDSWAIRWYASAFLENGLTLYPGRNLVRNIGTDNSGTHCEATSQYDVDLSLRRIDLNNLEVIDSQDGREAFKFFFLDNKRSILERLTNKFLSLFCHK